MPKLAERFDLAKWKPPGVAKPSRFYDTLVRALCLRVLPSGRMTWEARVSRAAYRIVGRPPAMSCGTARVQARALLAEGTAPASSGTVADICREYVTASAGEGRTASAAEDAGRRFDRLVYGDPIGKVRADRLTTKDVEAWRDRVQSGGVKLAKRKGRKPEAKPLKPATVDRAMVPLKAALNRAVERGDLPPRCRAVWDRVKPSGEQDRRERYLSAEERRALLSHAQGEFRDYLTLVSQTGCRPGDPAALLPGDWDRKAGTVRFRTKVAPTWLPVSPRAREVLDRRATFTLPAKDRADAMRAAVTAAGLPPDVSLYTLRHCWITDALTGGMDVLTVARLARTSVQMIQKHYGHLVDAVARERLAGLDFLRT